MAPIAYHSTNNKSEQVNFKTALLRGQPKDYGLYMIARSDVPKLQPEQIRDMSQLTYAKIAFQVLNPYLGSEIPQAKLEVLLNDAYINNKILTNVQNVTGRTNIMWLTHGPTYSFKDYAARFFGITLNYFLENSGKRRIVVVATSGDTGGAVADALYGLKKVDNIVFFPKGSISDGQRRQMTTLKKNIYAFEVNGDFDVCQALAKNILGDKKFAKKAFGDHERITSANSISIGRLLPQAVYPFYAYSRVAKDGEPMIVSIPSGNFGDMMGTVLAKEMGLPIGKIICGVNENTEFPDFLETGSYVVRPSKKSPSSAMVVSHPSNLARLIDFYEGHMFDERDHQTKKVIRPGVIDKMPDIAAMRKDIFSVGINNRQHYETMKEVFYMHGIVLDPHGAVAWKAWELFTKANHKQFAVIYETADPGKFPKDVKEAIGKIPELPSGMKEQAKLEERIYYIKNGPDKSEQGLKLSDNQINEAKTKIRELLS